MDLNTWNTIRAQIKMVVEDYANKRRSSRAALARKQELMAQWYSWQKSQHASIDAQYAAAEKQILGELPNQIAQFAAAESKAKAAAETLLGTAESSYRELLTRGFELPAIEMPERVTVSYEMLAIELDISKVPASLLTINSKAATDALRNGPVPGIGKAYDPTITVKS